MKPIIIIPAIKKKVIFVNDLVKQLAGISLIQRVINKAKLLNTTPEDIYLITDSEEICLIGKRNGVAVFYDKKLGLQLQDINNSVKTILSNNDCLYQDIIILSPYAPLIEVEEIKKAYKKYKNSKSRLLIPVKRELISIYDHEKGNIDEIITHRNYRELFIESKAFQIINSDLLINSNKHIQIQSIPYQIRDEIVEIRTFQDWWVCEKLLKKKRIIFRVIGGGRFGMGHIYRSMALAQLLTDHEVRFICDVHSKVAADQLLGYDYWLGVYEPNEIVDVMVSLEPDLVINDILNTDYEYIQRLHDHGVKVINFEDLGSGATKANLTINELYDMPLIQGENILWGHDYFFIRDEFNEASIHSFIEDVSCLLITFGGSDQNDFTRRVLRKILNYCSCKKIKIIIVTGPGYLYIDELEKDISRISSIDIEYTHSTGVMSNIMENAVIAITSNGRTVYELAHMNIPSIILSQHERENTHLFAKELNGFIPIGVYDGAEKEEQMLVALKNLVEDTAYRKLLFDRMTPFCFQKNKKKVEKLILNILET